MERSAPAPTTRRPSSNARRCRARTTGPTPAPPAWPCSYLRPVYHRLEKRIRAHVILCWLALLLIRITETTSDATWSTVRRELDRLYLGAFTGLTGLFRQVTALTKPQTDLLAKLNIPHQSRSSRSNPHPADQHEHQCLEKRLSGALTHVRTGHTQIRDSSQPNHAERRSTVRGRAALKHPLKVVTRVSAGRYH